MEPKWITEFNLHSKFTCTCIEYFLLCFLHTPVLILCNSDGVLIIIVSLSVLYLTI